MPTRKADPKEKQERMITELAVKRAELAQAAKALKDKQEELAPVFEPLETAKSEAAKAVEELEGKIRADFSELDKSQLVKPLNLVNQKTWVYDVNRASQWARVYAPHLLKFDPVAFKQQLNAVAESKKMSKTWFEELGCPVEFVAVPTIQIASDLEDWLPQVVPAEPEPAKTPAEIAEQISGEPDISAAFMPLENSGEASE